MSEQILHTATESFREDTIDYDELVERRGTDSKKWAEYGEGVIPLWVADMDFISPKAVLAALHERIHHGVFGYGSEPAELRAFICARMWQRYHWAITPEDI